MVELIMEGQKRILAFDIGIKNLAWCCGDLENVGGKVVIRGWSNENLISGGTAESDKAANRCLTCSHNAGYWYASTGNGYCVRHCPSLTPALRDLSGNLLKKVPKLPILKAMAKHLDAAKTDLKSRETVQKFLEKYYCFPKQPVAVKRVELEDIHDGLQRVVEANSELFESCDEILLENQPAFKNPVMKSVQMMLFATLRDLLEGARVRLVHAGRKTAGAVETKGDDGYAERKGAGEARVVEGLKSGKFVLVGKDAEWFSKQAKRSDLADCLCMVADCAGKV